MTINLSTLPPNAQRIVNAWHEKCHGTADEYQHARTTLMAAARIDRQRADQILTNTCSAVQPTHLGGGWRCHAEIGHDGCHTWERRA